MRTLTRLVTGTLPLAALLSFAACDRSPAEELPPPTIVLAAPMQTVPVGRTLQVTATVTERDGSASKRKIYWHSANENIATVDGSGLVTGVLVGATTIHASVGGTTQSVHITVLRAQNPGGPQSTFLRYTSTPGEWVGQGQTANYPVNSGTWSVTLSADQRELRIRFNGGGNTWWDATFSAPSGQKLDVGTYQNVARWPFQPPASPGLSFSGSGRGCSTVTGHFTIHDLALDPAGKLHRFHVTFRQHCDEKAPYLDGEIALLLEPLR
ncbi:MAG TPA: Ig-like domain-containing protein [Longimicrobium sp.]|nr:Ig-like domain-containing protein [Longimicrobium sp.]